MQFSPIEHGSDEYRAELALRDEVLRKPLGLKIEDDDLSQESRQWHFGLFEKEVLIASVIAVPCSKLEIQIRQMAVSNRMQGMGFGREIILRTEQYLGGKGITELFLHARVPVIGFYQKLGYLPIGGLFTEVGIPHQKMRKCLA